MRRRAGEEDGAVIVLLALFLVAICASAALAIDIGNLAQTRQHAQSAVDAAALSGASLLAAGESAAAVVTAAESYLQENYAGLGASDWNGCSASSTPGGFAAPANAGEDCITFNAALSAINVALPPRVVSDGLAQAVGLSSSTVFASAAAMVSAGVAPCALCLLSPSGVTLSDTGSGSVQVSDVAGNAGIAVDSQGTPAATITGSGTIDAPAIGIAGTDRVTGSGRFRPAPTQGIAPVPDPLAALPLPPQVTGASIPPGTCRLTGSGTQVFSAGACGSVAVVGSGSATIAPGVYSSITLTGSGNLTLEPGTYVITGALSDTGSGALAGQGAGVLLYFTCATGSAVTPCANGQAGGALSLTGSGSVTLAPATSGPLAGLTVLYDRNDTATLKLTGSGSLALSGTLYAKSAQLDLTGSGQTIDSMIDVGAADLTGSGSIDIAYDKAENVALATSWSLCSPSVGNC